MTWIKICGTTNLEDALMSVEAGADALGFVFWEKSPRNVDPRAVRKIVEKLPAEIEKVGVFVGEPFEGVHQIVEQARLTAAQLHFANPSDDWEKAKFKKYIVMQVSESSSDSELPKWADAVFLDSGNAQNPGGTGKAFDWQQRADTALVIRGNGHRVVVAGGLNPDNVGEAIRILQPWGVDVASGVEASPGKKDPAKVRAFVQAVREANR